MGVTSRGFTTFDPTVDKSKQMNEYITKDSKQNMELLNTQLDTLDEKIDNKLKLNNESMYNVNFIENEIVQDGLVTNLSVLDENSTIFIELNNSKVDAFTGTDLHIAARKSTDDKGWFLFLKKSTGVFWVGYYTNNVMTWKPTTIKYISSEKYCFVIREIKGQISIYLNELRTLVASFNSDGSQIFSQVTGYYNLMLLYNKSLTSKEIQHNLSVLNNSQSISKINDYAIATDTDHIEDRTGRTAEQINRVFYKQNCKEFTSNGEPITVNNGMDGYVLSGKIEGQTVKNEFYALPNNIRFSNGMMVLYNTLAGVQQSQSAETFNKCIGILKPSTVYSVILDVIETNYTQTMVFGVGNTVDIDVSTTGIKVGKFTTPSVVTSDTLITLQNKVADQVTGKKISFRFGFYEGDFTVNNPVRTPQFSLSSTQAVVYNNNLKYSFYKDATDKASGTVITLGGVGGVYDAFEIKEDGSGVYTQNTRQIVLNGVEDWSIGNNTLSNHLQMRLQISDMKNLSVLIVDKFLYRNDWNENEHLVTNTIQQLFLYIERTKLSTQDVLGFKAWLQANPVTVRYQLAVPVVTPIDKSLVPAILTQLQNQFTFGDAVAPYKVTIQAPVNRIAEMQAEINEIKALIQTPSNINLTMNYIEDEYNKNQSEEGAI